MQEISPQNLVQRAKRLLREQFTMTLATAHGDAPWAASVYYIHRKKSQYFYSVHQSRHVLVALAGGRASATVFADSNSWQEIRGLQMAGSVSLVQPVLEALAALFTYMPKYSLVKDFFKARTKMDLEVFKQKFNVRLYRFTPPLIYYVDNGIKFGFHQEVKPWKFGNPSCC
jgi:uncharacterized protein YhbP (UPF0306 family)